jgi:hypothetical protein
VINANEAQNGNTECSLQPRRGVVTFRDREGSNWQSLALLSSEKPRAMLPLLDASRASRFGKPCSDGFQAFGFEGRHSLWPGKKGNQCLGGLRILHHSAGGRGRFGHESISKQASASSGFRRVPS